MSLIARTTDLCACVCSCHPTPIGTIGTFITGASTVITEGERTVRLGDIAICSCGHITIAVTSASTVCAEDILVSRLGDAVSACPVGTIITSAAISQAE